ncbi:MAG TPA: outer membrane protein assembly factor BamA [Gemmatimonadaceae bacterium]|nr:outer membrane protein assembly factor BamA [Gemmatimonadaceae bacterium]
MKRLAVSLLFLCAAGSSALGQEPAPGVCTTPDSIAVTGNARVADATIRSGAGLLPHTTLNFRDVQRAIKALYGTGSFEDVQIVCLVPPAAPKTTLTIKVRERPILSSYSVVGADRVDPKDVKERLALATGRPLDPAVIAKAVERADSLYESKGYYLARIHVDSAVTGDKVAITFRIEEGRRLAISGLRVKGNKNISAADIAGVMESKPEGFWWFRKGEFDDSKYAADLAEKIPALYSSRGFIDFRILNDSLIIDREAGKAVVDLTVSEGARYKIGSFEVIGNKRFSTDEVRQFYPFAGQSTTLSQRAMGIVRRTYHNPANTFDASKWEEAEGKLRDAYSDEGYIYARIRPVVERVPGETNANVRTVNLRWEIEEAAPAIVNRIDIEGNDFTYESCIREQIVLAPGQVFNRGYLLRSYQNIGNLNFFETPMPAPETRPNGDQGDVDIVFHVKEKRTGNINFGASTGQGTGVGGFIGLDQPNLLGRCKRAQLQYQFGKYINDFNATYTDPNIRQTRISGSVTAYNTQSRFRFADLGRATRTGGQVQVGFPVPGSLYSRLLLSYGGEAVKYGDEGLLSTVANECSRCFRSTLGFTASHDTRIGLPFAAEGGSQTFTAQFNGGPLGGTASFQRYTSELRSYTPIGAIGGGNGLGSEPMAIILGLSARSGMLFGSPGPFFYSQAFSLGGTQYGEPLRGYDEFSITPSGYNFAAADGAGATRQSFGNAFFVGTAEMGLRVNQSLYFDTFFEGGNVWGHPREFDPTRLFRSAGFGAALVSPLGPIGIDIGYGFDRLDAAGRPAPGWKLHFKLGQLF